MFISTLQQITISRYAYCYELTAFSIDMPIPSLPDSVLIDNLCVDWQQLTYDFLSSAQGGKVFIRAPKAGMTVIFLVSVTIGIKLEWHSHPVVTFICQFEEPTRALHVYYEIHELLSLTVIDSLPA